MIKPNLTTAFLFALLVALRPSPASADKAPPDATLKGHTSTVLSVAFSPDGKRLASAGDDGLLIVWDAAGGKELSRTTGVQNNLNQVRFTPDGKTVIALGSNNNVVVFDAAAGKPRKPVALPTIPGGGASALDLSPDGKTIAVVGRSALRLIDLATGAVKGSYEVHPQYGVTAVAYSADGKWIATAGTDHTANVVEAATGRVAHTFKIGLNGVDVVFSPDGKTLYVSTTDRVLQSIDIGTGEATKLVEKGTPLLSLAVSKDGKSLFLGGPGHGPWIVALPDGKLTESAYDCDDWVKAVAVSPDGKWLAGGGNGGALYLWKAGN